MAIIQANAKLYVWSRMFPKVLKFDDFSKVIQSSTINMQSAFGSSATITRIKYAALTLTPNASAAVTASAIANPKRLLSTRLGVESFLEIRLPTKMSINYAMLGIDLATAKSVTLTMEEGFVREQGTGLPVPGRSLASIKGSVKAEATFVPAQANLSCVTSVKYTNNAAVLDASGGFTVSAQLNAVGVTDAQSQFVFDALVGVIKPYSAEVTSEANMVTDNVRARINEISVESTFTMPDIAEVFFTRSPGIINLVVESTLTTEPVKDAVANIVSDSFASMSINAVKTVRIEKAIVIETGVVCQINYASVGVNCDITSTSTLEQNFDLVFTYYGQNFQGNPFQNAVRQGQFTSDATIYWGDGTSEVLGGLGVRSHTYPSIQEWTIRVRVPPGSVLKGFNIIDVTTENSDAGFCVRKIKTFGQIGIISLEELCYADLEAAWIEELPDALPPTVTNLSLAFGLPQFYYNWKGSYTTNNNVTIAAKDHNLIGKRIQNWDVSKVTNFYGCFLDSTLPFPILNTTRIDYDDMDLRLWNTQSATNMERMFNQSHINQDLSGWCVPLIASTPSLFYVLQGLTPSPLFQPPVWGTCP